LASVALKGKIPKTNISSINTLKEKTKQILAEALTIISQKDNLDAIDIYYELVTKEGEPP
jgi:hypothetical protein